MTGTSFAAREDTGPPGRLAVVGLLGSTVTGGLLFAPVFGLGTLILPVVAVVLACYGCVELAWRWPRLAVARPVLVLLTGGLAVWVTLSPSRTPPQALWHGVADSWRLTLESTWPARPDPELLMFVPLAVLAAALLGIEILLRIGRAAALLPGLAVVVLAQAYQALEGGSAAAAVACYAAPAALVFWTGRPRPLLIGAPVVAMLIGAVGLGVLDPAGRAAYRIKAAHAVAPPPTRVVNPLREIAQRLTEPDREVFRYRADEPVDRWRLVVLDGFDGANWYATTRLLRLGAPMTAPAGSLTRTADVRASDLSGPWLPSQSVPLAVDGLAPLVDQTTGTLLLARSGPAEYRLTWSEPATLGEGTLDTRAPGGLGGLGVVPAGIDELARAATRGLGPTLQGALQLERYLSTHYQRAEGADLPTGHGWPQLREFLLDSERGTSEQFAAAYVVLARLTGIPARLVVGYRGGVDTGGGVHVVHNGDVLAWPEVAVEGVGWVPLDPTGRATGAGASGGLAAAAARAREQLPPEHDLRPAPETQAAAPVGQQDQGPSWLVLTSVPPGLLLGWILLVRTAKAVRTRRRRRRTGAAGVLAAWAEVRDRLAEHHLPYSVGMTPRDLAAGISDVDVAQPVRQIGLIVDRALWSPNPRAEAEEAWAAVDLVRRGLARHGLRARLRAALDPRALLRRGA
ncbi:transglutaminaseTgpA domain-containing protein [Hamadaea sp. NPDC050747]|uniref:transglutaminase family protein n=1 Tax=Hamadaea sp. NPDC050747 TaxID=3155789 RepID=UPI0033DA2383